MPTNTSGMSVTEICENFSDAAGKALTAEVLRLFQEHGLRIKVKDGDKYGVCCYIKTSKESVTLGMSSRAGFVVQLRITDRTVLGNLGGLSENVRSSMLNGPDCKESCFRKCETPYVFSFRGKEYRKCQALICNFIFRDIQSEDIPSLIGLIQNEIRHTLGK